MNLSEWDLMRLGLSLFIVMLPLLLLARCSHWAYHAQHKLDETNRLLQALLDEQRQRRVTRSPAETSSDPTVDPTQPIRLSDRHALLPAESCPHDKVFITPANNRLCLFCNTLLGPN